MTNAPQQAKAPAFARHLETTPRAGAGAWAVRMRDIGKQYRLGAARRASDNLREDVTNALRAIVTGGAGRQPLFWALRGVDLEVARGESVGIIGRNGAGKSTLLKILSRITPPTTGEMRYRGRLASLLEVGTGFHRELTGRENIFLNGSILGMRRHEIARQFDAIVDFAGVEQFLDTPVKFYSSGMYVRLAFAVAAHLRTDILVVDEVLAVGDAAFQKKCLGKMQDAASDGRTVLFVSHNMAAMQRLCPRAILLEDGSVAMDAESADVVRRYLSAGPAREVIDVAMAERHGTQGTQVRLTRCVLRNSAGESATSLEYGEPFSLELEVLGSGNQTVDHVCVVVGFDSPHDQARLASCGSEDAGIELLVAPGESTRLTIAFERPDFAPGSYAVTLALRTGRKDILDRIPQALLFDVMDVAYADRALNSFLAGTFRLAPRWEVEE